MATTRNPAAKSTSSKVNDPYGEEHEELLLVAHKNLPKLLTEALHSIAPLNEALAKLAPERRSLVEQMIKEGNITASQAAIWRAIPDIQLPDEKHPPPELKLGVTLYRYHDRNGTRKLNPEPLHITDFVIDIQIPKWSVGTLKKPNQKKPIANPTEGLNSAGLSQHDSVRILGIIIPAQMTLGAILREIEKVGDAARIDSEASNSEPPELFTLCVISREDLFEVLREKVDVMLVKGKELHCDFGYLLNWVTFDLAPENIDWDDVESLDLTAIN